MGSNETNIIRLLNISGDLEKLAEKIITSSEDEESLRLYGTILDSAHKLRSAAESLWKDAQEQ